MADDQPYCSRIIEDSTWSKDQHSSYVAWRSSVEWIDHQYQWILVELDSSYKSMLALLVFKCVVSMLKSIAFPSEILCYFIVSQFRATDSANLSASVQVLESMVIEEEMTLYSCRTRRSLISSKLDFHCLGHQHSSLCYFGTTN